MKLLGNGGTDTSLTYIWTFSTVLIFINMYISSSGTLSVPEEETSDLQNTVRVNKY